ncbi:MAG: acetyl-CoA carboxylase, carboxyltransferase subunit beta [Rhodospirillaceae bacterium]|jgi:acetyl-CoA carboxylase carboxyl transferase subunit beta|nr:acetyl-CoA carboxylase, carboxyltransferase subunit beta [Rhodospirillaceae bacterium]
MNWLTNFVRPKIQRLRAAAPAKEVPDNLWLQCSKCNEMVFHRELEKNLRVCTHCGHHLRMPVRDRLRMLFDDGKWQEIELQPVTADPLRFRDREKYADRLKKAQAKTGLKDAVVVGHGTMGGLGVVVAAFEFDFMGGSMGAAVGEAIIAAAELALLQEAPLIVIPSSGGARMQEGILSLMQMARTTVAVDKVKEKGLPYITVLSDPTTGGVTASFAMLGDVSIAEPGAIIGFAGARVIEQTIREKLPEGFQRSEYLMQHGMVDMVVPRHELRAKLVQLLGLLLHTNPAADVVNITPAQRRRKNNERESSSRLVPPDPTVPDMDYDPDGAPAE